MLEKLLRKTPSNTNIKKGREKEDTPDVLKNLWSKCSKCGSLIYREDVRNNHYVCPKCGGYFRLKAGRRLKMVIDRYSFETWDQDLETRNPLDFEGYEEKLRETQDKTGMLEAVITGRARIDGEETVIGVVDARFLMGSMGYVVGEKITRAVERATREKLPVIIFCCSGGARMQEGIVSLMQMTKTSAALKRHSDAGLLYVSVLTDPTTGGVTASFAMLGDIILAEPKALIGFAGPRVIEQTIKQKLPEGFQRSEFLLEHGFIDRIVERSEMKQVLADLIRMHKQPEISVLEGMSDREAMEEKAGYGEAAAQVSANRSTLDRSESALDGIKSESAAIGSKVTEPGISDLQAEAGMNEPATAWEVVERSRSSERLTALEYIEEVFSGFIEFHGDRYCKDDSAIIGGIAMLDNQPVTVIGQQKGHNLKENLARNFGMPSPDGYRKALRLMKQAEKFDRPIICLVDTPGAFCGLEAEERGQGRAIADNLFEMSALKTPILSIVIGEGGSGGALAMATSDEVWIMENAIYSILSPEGFASILWKDSKRASEAAEVMKITAKDLRKLGIVEKIIPEEIPACEENKAFLGSMLRQEIRAFLNKYEAMGTEELTEHRYNRFRNM